MKKSLLVSMFVLTLPLSACQTDGTGSADLLSLGQAVMNSSLMQTGVSSALSTSEISAGLREALSVGTGLVVTQLGKTGGFNSDAKIRIPLPTQLQKVDSALNMIGMGAMGDDLKNRMNAAAEVATPRAKQLFLSAIKKMTIADARSILSGPNDAATQYLRKTMGADLTTDIAPLVQNAMEQAGAVRAYDTMMGQYASLPFMPDVKANLRDYVVTKTLDGIFYYVAQEEAAIRENPAKRTTELLRKVFAKQ